MPTPITETYHDFLDYLVAAGGGGAIALNQAQLRRAVLNAYQSVVGGHQWNYLRDHTRIVTAAPVSGTSTTRVTYTHSTRELVHESEDWIDVASWVEQGRILLGGVVCAIDTVAGDTAVLNPVLNPGENISATASWTLYKNVYTLPSDFVAMHDFIDETGVAGQILSYDELMQRERVFQTAGQPWWYAIIPHPDFYAMAVALYPYPTDVATYDFVYHRKPRQLRITGAGSGHFVGTVSNTGTAVTGVGTEFAEAMVGSILRFGTAANVPDGTAGVNPYYDQQVVVSVTNSTTLTLDSSPSQNYSGVKYRISDPIDLPHHMLEAFTRDCERQLAILTNSNTVGEKNMLWREAMLRAFEADETYIPRGRPRHFDGIAASPIGESDDG